MKSSRAELEESEEVRESNLMRTCVAYLANKYQLGVNIVQRVVESEWEKLDEEGLLSFEKCAYLDEFFSQHPSDIARFQTHHQTIVDRFHQMIPNELTRIYQFLISLQPRFNQMFYNLQEYLPSNKAKEIYEKLVRPIEDDFYYISKVYNKMEESYANNLLDDFDYYLFNKYEPIAKHIRRRILNAEQKILMRQI